MGRISALAYLFFHSRHIIICIAAADASPAATKTVAEADRPVAAEKMWAREELDKCQKSFLAKRP
jgi:hypothetical protein